MRSEEEIKRELKKLRHDVEYTDCSRSDYCRMYAMISILEWIIQEKDEILKENAKIIRGEMK